MVQQLYGGAITTTIPVGLVDVSKFREIPDTQEVFISETQDDARLDQSIIFDLLEEVIAPTNEEALSIHLSEISEISKPETTKISTVHNPHLNIDAHLTAFIQAPPTKDKYSTVTMVALIKLDRASTDVVITVNVPFQGELAILQVEAALLNTTEIPSITSGYKMLTTATESYNIKDWSLFG